MNSHGFYRIWLFSSKNEKKNELAENELFPDFHAFFVVFSGKAYLNSNTKFQSKVVMHQHLF